MDERREARGKGLEAFDEAVQMNWMVSPVPTAVMPLSLRMNFLPSVNCCSVMPLAAWTL